MATNDIKFRWHKAITRSGLPASAKLIAFAIWEYTDRQGGNAHPGNKRLMEDTGMSLSTVKRCMDTLRNAGWLHRVTESNNHPSRKWADVYALQIPATRVQDYDARSKPTGAHNLDTRLEPTGAPNPVIPDRPGVKQDADRVSKTQTGCHPDEPPTTLYNKLKNHHSDFSQSGPRNATTRFTSSDAFENPFRQNDQDPWESDRK